MGAEASTRVRVGADFNPEGSDGRGQFMNSPYDELRTYHLNGGGESGDGSGALGGTQFLCEHAVTGAIRELPPRGCAASPRLG